MDYCTIADVKKYATGVQGSGLDALITSLITTESRLIDNWCNLSIGQASYTEYFDGNDTRRLATKRYPIQSVTSVKINNVAWTQLYPGTANFASGVGYTFDERFIVALNQKFPCGIKNIEVFYAAGYAVAPDDIRQATVELVAFRLGERGHLDTSSKTLNGEVVSYRNVSIPVTVIERIDNYRSYIPS